ncbi:MAG: phage terminase large subunit [Oligoflexus sp.]
MTENEITKQITLLDKQHDFVFSDTYAVLLSAGLGYGKTKAATAFVIRMVTEQPIDVPGVITGNSYKQIHRVILPPLKAALDEAGIKWEWQELKQILIANGRTIYISTSDQEGIKSIQGSELGWAWMDEAEYAPYSSTTLVEERLRNPRASGLYLRLTSTKNGFNEYYDLFEAGNDPNYIQIEATPFENPFLPPQYLPKLKARLTKKEYDQQVLNKRVTFGEGQVFDEFEQDKHSFEFDHDSLTGPTYVGWDQNTGNMCSVFAKYQDGVFYFYDEMHHPGNATGATRELKKRFPNPTEENPLIVPDSTIRNKHATSSVTGKQILQEAGFEVLDTRNPHISARQETMNAKFYNGGRDELKIVIHPRMKRTLKELSTLKHQDHEGSTAHFSVAMGYVIWKLEPMNPINRREATKPQIIRL